MHEITVVLAVILSAVAVGTTGLAILLVRNRSLSNTLEFCLNEIALLEEQLERTNEAVETLKEEAFLFDTKGKDPRSNQTSTTIDEINENENHRCTLPEQRSRIMKLAAKGSDTATIAATLGMSPAEVDLILRLKTFSANAA